MSYEIPKELKYEEKVLFNFSIWQAGCIAVSLLFAAIIFLKTGFGFEVKAILCMAFVLAGIGFAFFDLKSHIASVFEFASKPREFGFFSGEMQKFTGIKTIENDTLLLGDGSAKAIIEIIPINFQSLQKKEQESVIIAYMDFLNSLDFPIQIAAKTTTVSLDDYFSELEISSGAIGRKEAARVLDLKSFLSGHLEKNAVKNRLFYVVVPSERKHSEKSPGFLDSLDIRSNVCIKKLNNCGLSARRLNNAELAKLVGSYFESDVADGADYLAGVSA